MLPSKKVPEPARRSRESQSVGAAVAQQKDSYRMTEVTSSTGVKHADVQQSHMELVYQTKEVRNVRAGAAAATNERARALI